MEKNCLGCFFFLFVLSFVCSFCVAYGKWREFQEMANVQKCSQNQEGIMGVFCSQL